MVTLTVLLIVVAFALSLLEVVKSDGKSALAWAVFCLAVVLLIPHFAGGVR